MDDQPAQPTVRLGRRRTAAVWLVLGLIAIDLVVVLLLLASVQATDDAVQAITETPAGCTERALGSEERGWQPQTPAHYTAPQTVEFDIEHPDHDETRRIRCRVRIEAGTDDGSPHVVVDRAEVVRGSHPQEEAR